MTSPEGFDWATAATIVVSVIAAAAVVYGARVAADPDRYLRKRLAQDIDAWSKLPEGTAKTNMMRLIEKEASALIDDSSLPFRQRAQEQALLGWVFLSMAAFLPVATWLDRGTWEGLGWTAVPLILISAATGLNGLRLLSDAARSWAQAARLRRQRRQTGRA